MKLFEKIDNCVVNESFSYKLNFSSKIYQISWLINATIVATVRTVAIPFYLANKDSWMKFSENLPALFSISQAYGKEIENKINDFY